MNPFDVVDLADLPPDLRAAVIQLLNPAWRAHVTHEGPKAMVQDAQVTVAPLYGEHFIYIRHRGGSSGYNLGGGTGRSSVLPFQLAPPSKWELAQREKERARFRPRLAALMARIPPAERAREQALRAARDRRVPPANKRLLALTAKLPVALKDRLSGITAPLKFEELSAKLQGAIRDRMAADCDPRQPLPPYATNLKGYTILIGGRTGPEKLVVTQQQGPGFSVMERSLLPEKAPSGRL